MAIALILASAALNVSWNRLVKHGEDKIVIAWAIDAGPPLARHGGVTFTR